MKRVNALPGRYEGEEVRGYILGYKNNRWYRWTACKCCGKFRWVERNIVKRDLQPVCDSCCRSAKGMKWLKSYNKTKAKEATTTATKPIQKDTAKPQQLSLDCSNCPHKKTDNNGALSPEELGLFCLTQFEARKVTLEKTTAELEQVKAELEQVKAELVYALEENEKQAAEIKEKDGIIKTLRLSERKTITDKVFNDRVNSLAK